MQRGRYSDSRATLDPSDVFVQIREKSLSLRLIAWVDFCWETVAISIHVFGDYTMTTFP